MDSTHKMDLYLDLGLSFNVMQICKDQSKYQQRLATMPVKPNKPTKHLQLLKNTSKAFLPPCCDTFAAICPSGPDRGLSNLPSLASIVIFEFRWHHSARAASYNASTDPSSPYLSAMGRRCLPRQWQTSSHLQVNKGCRRSWQFSSRRALS